MRIHKEGRGILVWFLIILTIVHVALLWKFRLCCFYYSCITCFSLLLYGWVVWFFRDPKKNIFVKDDFISAPADGKVVAVETVFEDEYFSSHRIQISIFMSPLNVHINRNPISGTIKFFKYHAGKYLVAWHPKSSTKNERTTTVIENKNGVEVLFRQIAGFMARRICFYNKQGDFVNQGDECGFIKFGSRADVYLPLNIKVLVKVGDKVQSGTSMIAQF